MLFGGFIYIGFRSSNIILFNWINYTGFLDLVYDLRIITLPYKERLPDWFLYCLPDGLWIFSYVCFVLIIWKRKITKYSLLWILSLPLIFILCEFLQYYGCVPGTFDVFDIIFFIFGALLPILVNKKINI